MLISGATVLIAMAGMFVSGNSLFTTIGLGTMIVVLAAMVGSLTVLPAVLHRLGDRVEWGRVRKVHGGVRDDGLWGRVVGAVLRRPWTALLLAGGALFVLALPSLSMHTKLPNFTDFPKDLKIVRTYERIQAAFPGSQTPAQVVVKAPKVDTPQMLRAYDLFRQRALATGELYAPFTVNVNPDRTVAQIDFAIAGNGDNAASVAALKTLRDTVIPPIAATLPDTEVAVTGVTAGTYDFNQQMRSRLPYVFMFVLGLAFVLLLLTFRSIVIAAKAVALNLLSVGAAYGILVAVFQRGWLADVFGFQTNGAIVSWLPLFLFVVLFGLSMDYHVFILSRVKELHDARHADGRGGAAGDLENRRNGDERGDHHGRRLRPVRVAQPDHDATDGLRPRGRGLHRRDRRPSGAPARGHEAAGRVELVHADVARMAAVALARGRAHAGAEAASPGGAGPCVSRTTNRR